MANIKLKNSSVTGKVPLTTDLAYGEIALNYTDKKLYFKSSSNSIESFTVNSASGTLYDRQTYTATAAQTTFAVVYDLITSNSLVQVFINGVLIDKSEYIATNGSSIILTVAASLGDLVECIGFKNLYIAALATSGSGLSYNNATGTITLNSDVTGNANTVALRDSTGGLSATGVTLSAGTANGVAYLNGSKVLTTGSALTFDGSALTAPLSTTSTAVTQAAKTATTTIATTAFVDVLRSLSAPTTGTSGTLVVGDRGALVAATAGITVPASVFAARDVVTIANNSASAITISQGSGLTLYLVGTATTGNRTLAQFGISTVVFINATTAIISGGGLT